jgi:ubiquinone/menaquinone biosynthesis C-methylase UbiE
MKSNSDYTKFANYYDAFYSTKNYEADSERTRKLIEKFKSSTGKDMLEVACGTGNYMRYLKRHYNITGLDIDPDMLKIARRKFKDIIFIRADMRVFSLKKRFDVIICLFSSISHLKTYNGLEKAIRNFVKHLKPGGVVIFEPFINPELYEDRMDSFSVNLPDLKITRMNTSVRKGNIAVYDFHFLVGEKGRIKYFFRRMRLGMFESRKVLKLMKKSELKAFFLKKRNEYRGVYVGIKPGYQKIS